MSPDGQLYSSSNHPALGAQRREGADQSLAVFLDGVQVGKLVNSGNEITFTYNKAAKTRGLWISHAMKDLGKTYSGKLKDLPPFFSNLLPEGNRRNAVASSLGISPSDEFELFRVLGGEVIGNTRVVPKAQVAQLTSQIDADAETLVGSTFSDMMLMASDVNSPGFDTQSVPGVQSKVSRIVSLVRDAQLGHSHHAKILPLVIFKLAERQYKHLVANESFFMSVAERAGIRTAQHTLISDEAGDTCLLVERFDRRTVDGEMKRIYVEDGCQLLGRPPVEKYSGSFERLSLAVMGAVDDPKQAAEELFRAYIFSYGIGNGDLHSKNVSVWRNPESGKVEITPHYDIINTYVYGDKTMALSVEGNKTNISPKKFLAFAKRLGIEPERVAEIATEVSGAIKDSIPMLGQIGFDQDTQIKCAKMLGQRGGVIEDLATRALVQVPNPGPHFGDR